MRRHRGELAAFVPAAACEPRRRARRRRDPTPEAGAREQIYDGLGAHGIAVYRIGAGAFRLGERFVRLSSTGLPDLVALLPGGRTLWIEVKSARGRLSVAQVAFRNACLRTGNAHVVARSFADVEPFL